MIMCRDNHSGKQQSGTGLGPLMRCSGPDQGAYLQASYNVGLLNRMRKSLGLDMPLLWDASRLCRLWKVCCENDSSTIRILEGPRTFPLWLSRRRRLGHKRPSSTIRTFTPAGTSTHIQLLLAVDKRCQHAQKRTKRFVGLMAVHRQASRRAKHIPHGL